MKTGLLVAMVSIAGAGICFAGHGTFYPYDDGTPATKVYFMGKYSGYCPSGSVLQTVARNTGTAGIPTNVPPYLAAGELLSVSPQAAPCMGTDPLFEYYFGDGVFGTLCDVSDTHLFGYVRAFSGSTIPGSAYFGNSPCEPINPKSTAPSDNVIYSNVTVGTVNPAYSIPMTLAPTTNGGNGLTVTGVVFATAAGQNNQLQSGWVLVEWRYSNSTAWVTGANPVSGGGQFGFNPSVPGATCIYVRARVADAYTPSPGYPVSAEYLVCVVPEPALLAALAGLVLALRRRIHA